MHKQRFISIFAKSIINAAVLVHLGTFIS